MLEPGEDPAKSKNMNSIFFNLTILTGDLFVVALQCHNTRPESIS